MCSLLLCSSILFLFSLERVSSQGRICFHGLSFDGLIKAKKLYFYLVENTYAIFVCALSKYMQMCVYRSLSVPSSEMNDLEGDFVTVFNTMRYSLPR